MRDVVVRRTNDMHPQWSYGWTTVAYHVCEVYGVRVLDSADPKRTGVRIVVVLKLLDSMAKLMGKE